MLYEILSLLGGMCLIHGVLLGVILIFLSSNKKPSLVLGFFLFVFGLSFLSPTLLDYGILEENPFWMFLPFRFYFLAFPLLFIYVKSLREKLSFESIKLHLYPGILEFLVFSIVFVSLDGEAKLELFKSNYFVGYILAANIFSVIYLMKILLLIKENSDEMNDFHSDLENKLLVWLKPIAVVFLVMTFSDLVLMIVQQGLKVNLNFMYENLLLTYIVRGVLYLAFTYWLAFFGMKQFYIGPLGREMQKPLEKNLQSLDKSGNNEEFELIYEKLLDLLSNTKCYTDEELTIVDLAEKTNVHYRKLSKVINNEAGCNFNTFINKYRVEEAIKIMRENNRLGGLTLDVVGQESGFKSRSSLYSAFKKFEDKTPAYFMKN